MQGIYFIFFKDEKTGYVGLSKDIGKRIAGHRRMIQSNVRSSRLTRAISVFWERCDHDFDRVCGFEILEETSDLRSAEIKWEAIKRAEGWNLTNSVPCGHFVEATDQFRQRVSQAKRGVPVSAEHAAKISASMKARLTHDTTFRETCIGNLRAIRADPEVSARWRKAIKSPEARAKMSQAKIGNKNYRSARIMNVLSGEVFETITLAALSVGRNYSTLCSALSKNKSCGGQRFIRLAA
jgi:hypothetical protein